MCEGSLAKVVVIFRNAFRKKSTKNRCNSYKKDYGYYVSKNRRIRKRLRNIRNFFLIPQECSRFFFTVAAIFFLIFNDGKIGLSYYHTNYILILGYLVFNIMKCHYFFDLTHFRGKGRNPYNF